MKSKKYQDRTNEQSQNAVKEPVAMYGVPAHVFQGFSIKDDYSLVKKAHEGVNTDLFYSFADAIKMPEKTLASIINLSPRTISNYREQKKSLDANYSEHLLKLVKLYNKGKEVFGSIIEFSNWLEKPFWNSDEKASDWLNTSGGIDLLMNELNALEEGYPN
ncbi:MAG: DUF2384 domain-containing protein [Bergeyella sp.]